MVGMLKHLKRGMYCWGYKSKCKGHAHFGSKCTLLFIWCSSAYVWQQTSLRTEGFSPPAFLSSDFRWMWWEL